MKFISAFFFLPLPIFFSPLLILDHHHLHDFHYTFVLLDDGRERRNSIGRPMTTSCWPSFRNVVGAVVHADGVYIPVDFGRAGIGGVG